MTDVPRQRKSTPAELAASDLRDADFEPEDESEESTVFDIDAALPVEAEAKRQTARFRVTSDPEVDYVDEGETRVVEIPLLSEWPLRAADHADNGRFIPGFKIVMAEEDVEFLADLHPKKIGAIMERLVKVSGVTPGELRRSGPSSRKKRKR